MTMELTVPNRAEKRTYARKRKRLTLDFEGHATLDGLEIICRNVSLGMAFDLQERFAEYQRAKSGSREEREAFDQVLQAFGDQVESWNYQDEDEGGELGDVTFAWEMLRDEFDYEETMSIVNAHMRAVQGVPAPLPGNSADGQPSVEAQIPMDVPSPSLAS